MLKPLGEAMGGWASPAEGVVSDPIRLLAAGWAEIVGEEVARNSHPTRILDRRLLITTRSSPWSQQLSLLAERVLAAVRARFPRIELEELRFRVGRIPAPGVRPAEPPPPPARRRPEARPPAQTAQEAAARFRARVDAHQRAKQAAGWKECRGCAALIVPGRAALCITCANARAKELAAAAARLLFEAPWLGYAGTAVLLDGLTRARYESIRTSLLARWWEALARARAAKRLSRDGRERLIASSYVVLRSQLPPEEISPATVRNVLGDELHDLIYGTEQNEANVE